MCFLLNILLNDCYEYSATVVNVYDLVNVQIQKTFFVYKHMKLLDVLIPESISKIAYKFALEDVRKYIEGKTFIVKEKNEYVRLYYNNYYVNNYINNIIFYNYMIYK